MISRVLQSEPDRNAWLVPLSVGVLVGILASNPTVRATIVSSLAIVLVALAVLWTLATLNDIEPVYVVTVFGFLLLIFLINIPIQEITLSPDAFRYENKAWLTAQSWRHLGGQPVEYLNLRVQSYVYVGAVIYFLFGRSPAAFVVANISFWTFAILCWMIIAKQHLDLSRYGIVGFLLALYPAGIRYSVNIIREPLTYAFLALSFLFVFRWIESEQLKYLLLSFGTSVGVLLLRPELFLPFWVIIYGVALIAGPWDCSKHLLYTILVALPIGTVFVHQIRRKLPRYANPDYALDVSVLNAKLSPPPGQLPSYLDGMTYSSWWDVIRFLPVRIYNFTIAPIQFVPDEWSLISKAGLDAVFVLCVVILAITGIGILLVRWITAQFDFDQFRVSAILLLYYLAITTGYSLVISSPTAVRRRTATIPIIIVFTAIAVAKFVDYADRRLEIRVASGE